MTRERFRTITLLAVLVAALVISALSLTGAHQKSPGFEVRDVSVASPGTALTTTAAQFELKLWSPEDLALDEDLKDPTYGRVVRYSDGSGSYEERSFWLQTWNEAAENVQIYGDTIFWWIDGAVESKITVGKSKARLEELVDPGSVETGLKISWNRLTWRTGKTNFRLIARNLTRDELLSIATSLGNSSK